MSEHDERAAPRTPPDLLGERLRETVEREEAAAEAGPSDEEVRAALDLQSEDPEPPQDALTAACPHCEGWGVVKTGSLVPDQVTRNCPQCSGTGWVDRHAPPPLYPEQPAQPADPFAATPLPPTPFDHAPRL